MKSAIVLHPLQQYKKGRWRIDVRNYRLRDRFGDLLFWSQRLAEASEEKVSLFIQHNLKEDLLAVSVERRTKTIASHSKDPLKAIRNVARRVRKEAEEKEDASRKTEKRFARKTDR